MDLNCGFLDVVGGPWIVQAFVSAFLAILFLQSGLDKTFDYKGNLDWLKGHFAASFLSGTVPVMLGILTAVELAAGMMCSIGAIEALVYRTFCFSYAGTLLCALAIIMLFFGQRIAKDYAGAASLVSYFILVMMNLFFLNLL